MPKRSPASDSTRAMLLALAAKGSSRLPSYREMARRADVSTVTVWKCIRELEKCGELRKTAQGWCGVRSKPAPDTRAVSAASDSGGYAWQQVVSRMREDIWRGSYASGERLPRLKQLCDTNGVSAVTMRKALRELSRTGIVQLKGRAYFICQSATATPLSTILLIAFGRGQLEMTTPRTRDNLRAVELLCARHGLRLRVVTVANDTAWAAHNLERIDESLSTSQPTLGAIVWDSGLQRSVCASITSHFHRHGLATVLLSEAENVTYGTVGAGRSLQVYTAGSSVADGAEVGRFLIARGHRRVAYLSPYERRSYSMLRREGLIAAFDNAGLYRAVKLFESDAGIDSVSLSSVARGELQRVYENYANLEYSVFREMIRRRYNAPAFRELFAAALSDPLVSAWVCSNDSVGVEALHYLRGESVGVPRQVALIGFDDSLEACVEGLSSYSFDPFGLAQAMVNYLLMPDRPRKCFRGAPIRLDGFVNQRLTT